MITQNTPTDQHDQNRFSNQVKNGLAYNVKSNQSISRFSSRVNSQILEEELKSKKSKIEIVESDSDDSIDDFNLIPISRFDQASSANRFRITVYFLVPKNLYKSLEGLEEKKSIYGEFVIRTVECHFNHSTDIDSLIYITLIEINNSLRVENLSKQLLLDEGYQLRMSKKRGTADFDSPGINQINFKHLINLL